MDEKESSQIVSLIPNVNFVPSEDLPSSLLTVYDSLERDPSLFADDEQADVAQRTQSYPLGGNYRHRVSLHFRVEIRSRALERMVQALLLNVKESR
jgi:hypothetical protein